MQRDAFQTQNCINTYKLATFMLHYKTGLAFPLPVFTYNGQHQNYNMKKTISLSILYVFYMVACDVMPCFSLFTCLWYMYSCIPLWSISAIALCKQSRLHRSALTVFYMCPRFSWQGSAGLCVRDRLPKVTCVISCDMRQIW